MKPAAVQAMPIVKVAVLSVSVTVLVWVEVRDLVTTELARARILALFLSPLRPDLPHAE